MKDERISLSARSMEMPENEEWANLIRGKSQDYFGRVIAIYRSKIRSKEYSLPEVALTLVRNSLVGYKAIIASNLVANGSVTMDEVVDIVIKENERVGMTRFDAHVLAEAWEVIYDYTQTGGANCVQRVSK